MGVEPRRISSPAIPPESSLLEIVRSRKRIELRCLGDVAGSADLLAEHGVGHTGRTRTTRPLHGIGLGLGIGSRSSDGGLFWGCTNYPRCKRTLPKASGG